MSIYSEQINVVLRDRLVPKMNALSMDIAKIEPYSYSSAELEGYKRQLDYLSMVYDFLHEYSVGEEELDNSKLVNVVRLLDAPTRERKTTDFLGSSPSGFTKAKTGYRIFIDKKEITVATAGQTYLTPGTAVSITVTYTPTTPITGNTSMTLITGALNQTTDGLSISLQNKLIPLSSGGANFVFTAQAFEGVTPLSAPQVITIPIASLIGNMFYYGSGAVGLTPAQIQALTTLIEAKSSKTLIFSPNNQVLYFAYPAAYGSLTSILDQNDFEITSSFTKTTQTFTLTSPNFGGGTASYYVYVFNNLVTVNNFSVTFNF